MTSAELIAWYEGFNEARPAGAPASVVLMALNRMISLLDEVPTPYPVFVERYWPFPQPEGPWWRRWLMLWGPSWMIAHREAAADARRFPDACHAFRALGRVEGGALVTIRRPAV